MIGSPTFAPKSFRLRVVSSQPTAASPWPPPLYLSRVFPVLPCTRLQMFQLPEPILVAGLYLQVRMRVRVRASVRMYLRRRSLLQFELQGSTAMQFDDMRFYQCISFVHAIGHVLPFQLRSSPTGAPTLQLTSGRMFPPCPFPLRFLVHLNCVRQVNPRVGGSSR